LEAGVSPHLQDKSAKGRHETRAGGGLG